MLEVKRQPSGFKFKWAEDLKGLKIFISMTDAAHWKAVEKRFDKMAAKTGGLLVWSRFGECLGIDSKEFALELLDFLAKRMLIAHNGIFKLQLKDIWGIINHQSFDSRLSMFFIMADKDRDYRLTEEEVREFVRLTASANNQYITQETVNKYAAVIMEELDPEELGYIYEPGYIYFELLGLLLLDVEILSEITSTEETKKLPKKWYKAIGDIASSSLIRFFKKRASKKKK